MRRNISCVFFALARLPGVVRQKREAVPLIRPTTAILI